MKMKMNMGEGRGQATKQCIIIFQDRINEEKNRVHLCLIVVNIIIAHLIFDIIQWQTKTTREFIKALSLVDNVKTHSDYSRIS